MTGEMPVDILLVDDNVENLVALQAILEQPGQRLVTATSGRDALRALLRQDFAVILLDVNMPLVDGFETAALIRDRPRSRHTPIIFITAYGEDEHLARAYALGAVDSSGRPWCPTFCAQKSRCSSSSFASPRRSLVSRSFSIAVPSSSTA